MFINDGLTFLIFKRLVVCCTWWWETGLGTCYILGTSHVMRCWW